MTLSSTHLDQSSEQAADHSTDRVKLPKPDLQNITVLTRQLPNSPILPWNHYDSPGLDQREAEPAASELSDSPA